MFAEELEAGARKYLPSPAENFSSRPMTLFLLFSTANVSQPAGFFNFSPTLELRFLEKILFRKPYFANR